MTCHKNVALILAFATLLLPTTSFSNEPQTVADEQQEEVVIEQPKSRYELVCQTVRSHVLTNQKIYAGVAIATGLGLLAFAISSPLLKPMALPDSPDSPEKIQAQQLKERAAEIHSASAIGKPYQGRVVPQNRSKRVHFEPLIEPLTDSGRALLASAQQNGLTERQTLDQAINQRKPGVVELLVAGGVNLSGRNKQGVGVDTLSGIHVTVTSLDVLDNMGYDDEAHRKAVATRNVITSALSSALSDDSASTLASLRRPRNSHRALRVI